MLSPLLVTGLFVFGIGVANSSPPGSTLDLFQSLSQDLAKSNKNSIENGISLNGIEVQSPEFFDQLLDQPKLDKICKTHIKEKHTNVGLENLLQIVCKKRNQVLKQNADCLLGMEKALRPGCENVCLQKINARVEKLGDKCGLGLCVSKCVDSQMGECFVESDGEVSNERQTMNLYSEVISASISINLNAKDDNELEEILNGLPEECSNFMYLPVRALRPPSTQSPDSDQHNLDNQF